MQTTMVLDDELLASAKSLRGIDGTAALVHATLKALIERESGRRLARLGGPEPDLAAALRRRAAEGSRSVA